MISWFWKFSAQEVLFCFVLFSLSSILPEIVDDKLPPSSAVKVRGNLKEEDSRFCD